MQVAQWIDCISLLNIYNPTTPADVWKNTWKGCLMLTRGKWKRTTVIKNIYSWNYFLFLVWNFTLKYMLKLFLKYQGFGSCRGHNVANFRTKSFSRAERPNRSSSLFSSITAPLFALSSRLFKVNSSPKHPEQLYGHTQTYGRWDRCPLSTASQETCALFSRWKVDEEKYTKDCNLAVGNLRL